MPKKEYILDINCWLHAANLVNHKNKRSYNSCSLLVNIGSHCDTILVTQNLLNAYWNKLSKLEGNGVRSAGMLINILRDFLSTENKTRVLSEPYKIPQIDDSDIPKNDKSLVKLALVYHATLVSADHRLIKKLKRNEKGKSQYGIRVLTPKEANLEIIKHIQMEREDLENC